MYFCAAIVCTFILPQTSSTNFENDLELSQYIFGLQANLISKIKYEITSQTISPREIVKLRYPMFTEEEIDQYFTA